MAFLIVCVGSVLWIDELIEVADAHFARLAVIDAASITSRRTLDANIASLLAKLLFTLFDQVLLSMLLLVLQLFLGFLVSLSGRRL